MRLKDNAWLSNSGKRWRTMKPNQVYHYDGQQNLGYSEKNNPNQESYASLFLPGLPVSWTEGSGAGRALVKHEEREWAAAVCCQLAGRPALHEHLQVEVSHTKGKGISLPRASRENKYNYTSTPQSENKAMKKKALSPTGQELQFYTIRKRHQRGPHCWYLRFPSQKGNVGSEILSLWCRKPLEPPIAVITDPWTRRKSNRNSKLLVCTKEHKELQHPHGQPERKGPQCSYVPTGEDALMLSKNYSLEDFCTPSINKTHHQWGGPRQRKCR